MKRIFHQIWFAIEENVSETGPLKVVMINLAIYTDLYETKIVKHTYMLGKQTPVYLQYFPHLNTAVHRHRGHLRSVSTINLYFW